MARVTGVEGAISSAAEEAIVQAIESKAAERALARVLRGPVVEDAVEQALRSPAVERSLAQAIDSEMVDRVWERLLASDEVQKLVERIAAAPEVRAAIASQGVGLVDDLGREAARATHRLDGTVERLARRLFRRPVGQDSTDTAGLVSRLLAFVLDMAILNAGFVVASALVTLVISALFGQPDRDAPALVIGTGAWIAAVSTYLLTFWTLSGQTPGMRFLRIRLAGIVGERRIGLRSAVRRLAGGILAAIPFGAGFLAILFSGRRRGWHDRLAGTEVVYVETRPRPAPWSGGPAAGDPTAAVSSRPV